MDDVLVCLMITTLISNVQSHKNMTPPTSAQCYRKCPPGFHVNGACKDSPNDYYCEKCGVNTFTAIEHTRPYCERCRSCPAGEVQKKECTSTNDTVCQCRDGYYKPDPDSTCKLCSYTNLNNRAWREKCQSCQWPECLRYLKCRKQCAVPAAPTSTYHPSKTTTSSSSSSSSSPSSSSVSTTTVAREAGVPWRSLVVAVTVLVFLLLVMHFTRKLLRKADRCFCWSENKSFSVEAPERNEQCKLQGSSPTTLTFEHFEETPIMSCSQNTTGSGPPALLCYSLPAVKQESQSEHWPAIVLYAIINAVPLRRWKEFLRLLSVADQQLERVELEAGLGLGFIEKQYQMLRLWSQRSSASLREVFSALQYMNLSGCAQILQENLDTLPWKHKSKQIPLSYRDLTECELSEVVQDTTGGNLRDMNRDI